MLLFFVMRKKSRYLLVFSNFSEFPFSMVTKISIKTWIFCILFNIKYKSKRRKKTGSLTTRLIFDYEIFPVSSLPGTPFHWLCQRFPIFSFSFCHFTNIFCKFVILCRKKRWNHQKCNHSFSFIVISFIYHMIYSKIYFNIQN